MKKALVAIAAVIVLSVAAYVVAEMWGTGTVKTAGTVIILHPGPSH